MAKTEAELKQVKPSFKKVAALITGKNTSGTTYWIELEGSTYVGTRHWLIRTQVMVPEIRAALAKIGLYEAGKAISFGGALVDAPDITKLLSTWNNATPKDLSDTRLVYDSSDDGLQIRLLHEQSGRKHHALNNDYFKAIDALFPHSQLTARGQTIVFGNLQAVILPFNFAKTASYTAVQRYMKQDINSAGPIEID